LTDSVAADVTTSLLLNAAFVVYWFHYHGCLFFRRSQNDA